MRIDTGAAALIVLLTSTSSHAEPPPQPPLYLLCAQPSVLLDLTVASADEDHVAGTVNAVFVRDDSDAGGMAAEAAPGDEVTLDGGCASLATAGARVLLFITDTGRCLQSFAVDDAGRLEDAKPDEVTVDEAVQAAFSDDCESALAQAGYDPPRESEVLETLFGCASASPGGGDALVWLSLVALLRGVTRRRSSRSRAKPQSRKG